MPRGRLFEWNQIIDLCNSGISSKAIADRVGCNRSTVSRIWNQWLRYRSPQDVGAAENDINIDRTLLAERLIALPQDLGMEVENSRGSQEHELSHSKMNHDGKSVTSNEMTNTNDSNRAKNEKSFSNIFQNFVSQSKLMESSDSSSEDDAVKLLNRNKVISVNKIKETGNNVHPSPTTSMDSTNSSKINNAPPDGNQEGHHHPEGNDLHHIANELHVSNLANSMSHESTSSASDYEDDMKKRGKRRPKTMHRRQKRSKMRRESPFSIVVPNGNEKIFVKQDISESGGENSSFLAKKPKGRPRMTADQKKLSKFMREERREPTFLQDGPCHESGTKLSRCRECRIQKSKTPQNIFCRFYHFRKLKQLKSGPCSAGFADLNDCTEEDLRVWVPAAEDPPKDLDEETAKFLLANVGDQLCDLLTQEKDARSYNMGSDFTAWKRLVSGVREMCDVCETTLFNIHWVCKRCGFVVCIDCYKTRKQGVVQEFEDLSRDRDEFQWLFCANRQSHEHSKLMMTQIIPDTAIEEMSHMLHETSKKWNIPSNCKCFTKAQSYSNREANDPPPSEPVTNENGICKQLMSSVSPLFTRFTPAITEAESEGGQSHLDWTRPCLNLSSNDNVGKENISHLISLRVIKNKLEATEKEASKREEISSDKLMESAIKFVFEEGHTNSTEQRHSHYLKRFPISKKSNEPLSIRTCTLTESTSFHPTLPHSWLCNGKLLLLKDPLHEENIKLFQEQWKRGQPVLVSNVSSRLDMNLWHPDGFCRDFGDITNDLVNCKTGAVIPDLPMRKFWEGFENFTKRMKDEEGEYMLLKLKDWPPGEDFSEKLPMRFADLMKVLPLAQYTHRDGVLNLAGRLPMCYVRPDLGPKMYNAYGSALFPTKGTTNLHLDMSDAVNVMVYVGVPNDGQDELHIEEALRAIDAGGCDPVSKKRVREKDTKPGALWHIYNARDADKIRALLTKVAIEKGEKLEAHHDPIHDQSWYLEDYLRQRLYKEYGVQGYAIAQCLGDAVFIPAGAPHQVRNLHSCVKVAEDFVSPENVGHCFNLTQEFRHLSDTHTNHEDKLQIKNIIYHTVRDALAVLNAHSRIEENQPEA